MTTLWAIFCTIWGTFGLIGLFGVIKSWGKIRAEYRRKKRLREIVARDLRDHVIRSARKQIRESDIYKAQKPKPRGPIGS